MRIVTAVATGLGFGVASIATPWLQSRLGYYLPWYLQPLIACSLLFVVGAFAGIRGRRAHVAGSIGGHLWLATMVASGVLVATAFALGRSWSGYEHFLPQLQIIGAAIALCSAFLGYGVGKMVSIAEDPPDYRRRR